MKLVGHWNRMPVEVAEASSLDLFEGFEQSDLKIPLPMAVRLLLISLKFPSNLSPSKILCFYDPWS